MLQSPLYIDTKCTTGSSPPVLGCGGGLGLRLQPGPRMEAVMGSQCEVLHEPQRGKRMERWEAIEMEVKKKEKVKKKEGMKCEKVEGMNTYLYL